MNKISPKNLTAQLAYRGVGNPPGTHPSTAVSNAFPGLEMDFRNAFRRIFEGIVLHEAYNLVVEVETTAPADMGVLAEQNYILAKIGEHETFVNITGPNLRGEQTTLIPDDAIEWSNLLADIITKGGSTVTCTFTADNRKDLVFHLKVREFFEKGQVVISRDMVHPGELTQSLCSPWQNDYRECACFYWAASRPDYINLELGPDGRTTGHNWLQKERSEDTKNYIEDDTSAQLVSYRELFEHWENHLAFIIDGKDIK